MRRMWMEFIGAWILSTLLWLLVPLAAQAASLADISLGTGYYNQPVSQTGGAVLTLNLPYGTLPRPFSLLPETVRGRLFYSLGGRFFSSGPGVQPQDGLFLIGLGFKLHDLLGVSYGLSRYQQGDSISNVAYWAINLDARIVGKVLNPELVEKLTGP